VGNNKTNGRGGPIDLGKMKGINGQPILSSRCPKNKRTRIFRLEAGNLSVIEYAAKFNEFSGFAPHQLNNKERKMDHFE